MSWYQEIMTIWYSADWHLGHKNIIKYANRPFQSVDEMNEELVRRWNERVSPTDTAYMLGDFAFLPAEKAHRFLTRLHGSIFLVPGNHDSREIVALRDDPAQGLKGWSDASPLHEIIDGKDKVVLCHFCMRVWNRAHHGALHLFGHSHGNMKEGESSQCLDVGVDCWDYRPVSLREIKAKMATLREYRSGDHHSRKHVDTNTYSSDA